MASLSPAKFAIAGVFVKPVQAEGFLAGVALLAPLVV